MNNIKNEKPVAPKSAKLRLSKETLVGLSARTGIKAGLRTAQSVVDGAGGSCTGMI